MKYYKCNTRLDGLLVMAVGKTGYTIASSKHGDTIGTMGIPWKLGLSIGDGKFDIGQWQEITLKEASKLVDAMKLKEVSDG